MNRLRPVPTKDFEANFEESLGIISWFIPIPVSFIDTITLLLLSLSFLLDKITMLPFCVNLIALSNRLEMT